MTDVETTQQMTRGEAADYLRQFADQLDDRPTDPLTGGLYETDREPADSSSTAPATDTSTRGRTAAPGDDASTHGVDSRTTGDPGTESDGGTDATARTGDESPAADSVRDGRVTILVGNDSATVNPPRDVEMAVAVGTDDSLVTSAAEQFVSFELTWDADAVDDEETLDIE